MNKLYIAGVATIVLVCVAVVSIFGISIANLVYSRYLVNKDSKDDIVVYHAPQAIIGPYSPRFPAFKEASQLFKSMINYTADPCNNFYEFTCGNFNDKNIQSFSSASMQTIDLMAKKLEDPEYTHSTKRRTPKALKKLFTVYESCKNPPDVVENAYFKEQFRKFEDMSGLPFPLLQPRVPILNPLNKSTIASIIGYLSSEASTETFLASSVDTNWKDPQGSTAYMFYIDQSNLIISASTYVKGWDVFADQIKKLFVSMLTSSAEALNMNNVDDADIEKVADDILTMEHSIAVDYLTDDTTRREAKRNYNLYDIKTASQQFPNFDWSTYFKKVSKYAPVQIRTMMASDDFQFIIMEPRVTQIITNMMTNGKFSATLLANYFYLRLAFRYSSYISTSNLEEYSFFDLSNIKSHRFRTKKTIWKPKRFLSSSHVDDVSASCTAVTMDTLPYANARVLMDATYPTEESRKLFQADVSRIIENVVIGFRSQIDQLKWMSVETKKGAYNKIDNLVKNIAFPDFIANDDLLDKYYEKLDIEADKRISNSELEEKLRNFDEWISFELLEKSSKVARDEFNGAPGVVNSWFQPQLNSITFPAAILRQPFYDPQWPASLNYGSFGVIAGHELTHGFDDQGIQWDAFGALNNWMDANTSISFKEMADCVIQEYSGFCPLNESFPDSVQCLNGRNTQGENIADNGGIHAAYRGYRNFISLEGPDPLLNDPIMSQFTHDQLFFLGFAQVWCQNKPSELDLLYDIILDPHSPGPYRVFGTIQNFPAFRSAFNCPGGDTYSPKNHCNVWVSNVDTSYGIPSPNTNKLNLPTAKEVSPNQMKKYEAYSSSAKRFKKSLNLKADPCNNFYEYVCNNFDEPASFRSGDEENFQDMATQLESKQYSLLGVSEALRKTVKYYEQCKNARRDFNKTIETGNEVLNALYSFANEAGFNFSMVYNQSNQTIPLFTQKLLGKLLGFLSSMNIDTLLSPSPDTNWKDPTNGYLLFVDQNTLVFPKTYYSEKAWQTVYPMYFNNTMNLFYRLFTLLKITPNEKQLLDDVRKILQFEKTLASIYSTSEDKRRKFERSYNLYNVTNATYVLGFIDIPAYFESLSRNYRELRTYFSQPNFVFSIMEPEMLQKLSDSIITMDRKHGITVSNYLFYRILVAKQEFLPNYTKYRPLRILSEETYIGRRKKQQTDPFSNFESSDDNELRKHCAFETLVNMKYANARFFVDFRYPDSKSRENIKNSVRKMSGNILRSFQSMIDRLEWMDEDSKKGAYEKISNIQINIAYPDFILNNTALDAYYRDLTIDSTDTYLSMRSKLSLFNFKDSYKVLLQNGPVDRQDFLGPPGIVNAWYSPEHNSITFPAGILRRPFYDENWPASLNYGGLGLVAGHELSHGFDDEGVQWNYFGALNKWMSQSSSKHFSQMADCVINEYSNFCPLSGSAYKPQCINGNQTQGENIADNGGIHAAYISYLNHVQQNGDDPQLPGELSEYTHNQLFFLNFAQLWCQQTPSKNSLYRQILFDPHSPSKYRIFGTIQNFPAFRDTFHCPVGCAYGPMTGKYCSVWVPSPTN